MPDQPERANSSRHAVVRRGTPRRSGRAVRAIVVLLASAALVSAVGYGSSQFLLPGEDAVTSNLSTHRVSRSDLVITVTEDGNLESASNIDVKCQVAGGSSILWIVPDGSVVQKGDKLVELDAAAIEDQINTQ